MNANYSIERLTQSRWSAPPWLTATLNLHKHIQQSALGIDVWNEKFIHRMDSNYEPRALASTANDWALLLLNKFWNIESKRLKSGKILKMLMSSFFVQKWKSKDLRGYALYGHVLNLCYSLMVIVNLKHVQMWFFYHFFIYFYIFWCKN